MKTKQQNVWITCGVVLALLICGGVVFMVGGFGTLVALYGIDPEGLTVTVEAPDNVVKGEDFRMIVRLGNVSDQPITVSRIDLPHMDTILVLASDPFNLGQTDLAVETQYQFAIPLAPGETKAVTFTLRALSTGEYNGDVKSWVGSRSKYSNVQIAIKDGQGGDSTAARMPYESVVQIIAVVDAGNGKVEGWSGSGSIISPDGLILTNAHVVLSDRYYDVKDLIVALTISPDQLPERRFYAEVLQADVALDIAVIRVTRDLNGNPLDLTTLNLPAIKLSNSDTVQLGDPLTILGYPGIGGDTITLTSGEAAGFTSEEGVGNRAFIKTSATIAGGNSGGLAANKQGELIGIPTQLGYGGNEGYVDCRPLADTNRDNVVDEKDNCVPVGGFINALRPVNLTIPYIEAAKRGEVNIIANHTEDSEFVPTGSTVFQDDFSNPNSGWSTNSDADGSAGYEAGEYFIRVTSPNMLIFGNPNLNLTDVEMTLDVRVTESVSDGDYGAICRYQDNQNFYTFLLSEDGFFTIGKFKNGEFISLYDWEASSSLDAPGPLKMTILCQGNQLKLAVNDILLAETTDDEFASGNIGLVAGVYNTTGMKTNFDNLIVREP